MTMGRHPAAIPSLPGGWEKFAAVGSRFPAERGLIELSVDCAGERRRGNLSCFQLPVMAAQTQCELSLSLPGKSQHTRFSEFKAAAAACSGFQFQPFHVR